MLILNCWEATEKSEKGLRSLTKKKARRNKTGALKRQPQYLQEDSLKAEVFYKKEDIASGKNSLTVPLIQPHLMIQFVKAIDKTLNKASLPLKKTEYRLWDRCIPEFTI